MLLFVSQAVEIILIATAIGAGAGALGTWLLRL